VKKLLALLPAIILAAGFLGASPLASGVLPDQFGHEVRVGLGEGRPVLIFSSDRRDAAELMEAWARALAPFPLGVAAHFVADLKALPFFVPRGAVSAWLARKHPKNPILLDWTGSFSKGLAAARNDVTVLVFGPDGSLWAKASGIPTEGAVAELKAALGRATPPK
jgi:hypothetical protein